MTSTLGLGPKFLLGNRRAMLALAVCGLPCWFGCGSQHPEIVPVRGRVTLAGGAWPKHGMLIFLPQEPAAGMPRRAGQAPFDVDGRFSAQAFSGHDGLLPGTYMVRIECWEIPPGLTPTPAPKSYLPPAFLNAPGGNWTLQVEPGKAIVDLAYDVPSN
jgi:hypothetical protein